MARDYDTPLKLRRAYLQAKLKTITCPVCRQEFKQVSPNQRFCSEPCSKTPRSWQPKVKKIFDEFVEFSKRHSVSLRSVVDNEFWGRLTLDFRQRQRQRDLDKLRSKVANQLKIILDRFRRGYYIVTESGIQFQNPPWQPYCPVDHTYCKGAILPHDCPRRHPECVYTNGTWKEICQLRGIYEIDMDKNASRNYYWRSGRPLIGFKVAKPNPKPNEPQVRPDAAAGKTPRAKTADRDRLSHGRNSL